MGPFVVRIDPSQFTRDSHWNVWGPRYDKPEDYQRNDATYTHAYGRDVGRFVYTFKLNSGDVEGFFVSARVSSEIGGGQVGPPEAQSDVYLKVNGILADIVTVIPDDQSGARVEWEMNEAKLQTGINTLEFGVADDAAHKNGLCIYWKPLKPGFSEEPIRVEVTPRSGTAQASAASASGSLGDHTSGLLLATGSGFGLTRRRRGSRDCPVRPDRRWACDPRLFDELARSSSAELQTVRQAEHLLAP